MTGAAARCVLGMRGMVNDTSRSRPTAARGCSASTDLPGCSGLTRSMLQTPKGDSDSRYSLLTVNIDAQITPEKQ